MNAIQFQITTASPDLPATPNAARLALEQGNRDFAALGEPGGDASRLLSIHGLGLSAEPGKPPEQRPFAAVLSCADARVPVEWIFSQAANAIFVLRVAGNLLTTENLGSLHYAVEHLHDIRLLVVLGHTGCGAVGAAAKAYLSSETYMEMTDNPPLRAVIDPLMAQIHQAEVALAQAYGPAAIQTVGYRAALGDLASVLNAAQIAHAVQAAFRQQAGSRLEVVWGVYHLGSRLVGLPATQPGADWTSGLQSAPAHEADLQPLTRALASSGYIQKLLSQT